MIAVVKAAAAKSKSKLVFPAITNPAEHHTGLYLVGFRKEQPETCRGLRATACAILLARPQKTWATHFQPLKLWSATLGRA